MTWKRNKEYSCKFELHVSSMEEEIVSMEQETNIAAVVTEDSSRSDIGLSLTWADLGCFHTLGKIFVR